MTKVLLIRHGETHFNIQKRFQGFMDSPLTEKGIAQAKLLSERLKNTHIDVIYTSSLGRAVETAALIKGDKDIKIIENDNLREMNLDRMEGYTTDELMISHKEQYHNFWNDPDKFIPDGGETFEELRERISKEISKIVKKHRGQTIAIVSHTVAIKSYIGYIDNLPIAQLWNPPFLHQTSLTVIDYEEGKGSISMYADISHLTEEKAEKTTKTV